MPILFFIIIMFKIIFIIIIEWSLSFTQRYFENEFVTFVTFVKRWSRDWVTVWEPPVVESCTTKALLTYSLTSLLFHNDN